MSFKFPKVIIITGHYGCGKTNIAVNEIVTLTAPTKDIKFRMICVANAQSSDGAALEKPNGGTCRIAGDDTGTSPVIKVME